MDGALKLDSTYVLITSVYTHVQVIFMLQTIMYS